MNEMTNFERIKNMSVEEMALAINNGISSDPCDYCNHTKCFYNGIPCIGEDNIHIIEEWLNSEAEE